MQPFNKIFKPLCGFFILPVFSVLITDVHGDSLVVPSTTTVVSTGPVTAESAGFTPATRVVTGKIQSVHTIDHRLHLTQANGEVIELAVPENIVIHSHDGSVFRWEQLSTSTTVKVRYNNLSMQALEIWEQP
jgi:hypothetical protein